MNKQYYVYILGSARNGTLYIGMTNNLYRRIKEHKEGLVKGFSKKYKVDKLVYYETFSDVRDAIDREKNLKKWKRAWKLELIENRNPYWDDWGLDYLPDGGF